MKDAVEEAPLAQFKSAVMLSLQEEEGLEMYRDLVKEIASSTDKEPLEVAAAMARLARRAQEPEILERISGYELEEAVPGKRASRASIKPSFDTNTQAAPAARGGYESAPREERDAPRGGGGSYKPVEDGMVRLFISAGRMDGIRPGDLVGAIAGETGIEGSAIGSIDIFSRYSFVEVPDRHSERVVESMNGAQVRGREVTARPATAPDAANAAAEGDDRGGGGGYRGGGGGFRRGGGGGYRGGGGGYRGGGGGYRGGGGGYRGGGGGYRGGGGGYRGGGGGGYGDGGGGGYRGGGSRRGGGGYRRGGSRRGGGGGYGGGWADTSGGSGGGGYDDSY